MDERDLPPGILRRNTTGTELIRADVPSGRVVADTTGTGRYRPRNDIGVIWPPTSAPIVLAVLSTRGNQDAEYDNTLIEATSRVGDAQR